MMYFIVFVVVVVKKIPAAKIFEGVNLCHKYLTREMKFSTSLANFNQEEGRGGAKEWQHKLKACLVCYKMSIKGKG